MKKIKYYLGLAICCTLTSLGLFATVHGANVYVGNGNSQIENKEELLELLKAGSNTKDYVITADIDLDGADIQPLKVNYGTIDGSNHTISNFTILREKTKSSKANNYIGLFGFNKGTLRSIQINQVHTRGYNVVGTLCGHNNGIIENCNGSNLLAEGYSSVGALIGNNISTESDTSTISNCNLSNKVEVKATQTAGGFIGFNRGIIKSCVVNPTNTTCVYGKDEIGGFAGENEGSIKQCITNKSVSATGTEIGGFVGDNDSIIEACIANGSVKGQKQVGGFAGASSGTIDNSSCLNGTVTCNTKGKSMTGGFIGFLDNGIIKQCSASNKVSCKGDNVGGFAGMAIHKTKITNCTVAVHSHPKTITGRNSVGGFIGSQYGNRGSVLVKGCKTFAKVTGKKDIGGFIGKNYDSHAIIQNSKATSIVTGITNVGAFVGYNANNAVIKSSKKLTSKITGKKNVFAGKNKGKMKSCK